MSQQWGRLLSLIVAGASGDGIELAQPYPNEGLRCRFRVVGQVVGAPTFLSARVYNPAPKTIGLIRSMPTVPVTTLPGADDTSSAIVQLKAGYPGNFGTIFQGNLMQTRVGKETPVDTHIDIFAADGDWSRNWGVVNRSLAAGWTPGDVSKVIADSFATYGTTQGSGLPDSVNQTPAPRGKVCFGMARDYADNLARTHGLDWFIQRQQLHWLDRATYMPGDVVELSPDTGLLGFPQQTEFGVTARCLLNPALGNGARVRISPALIQQQEFTATAAATPANLLASVSLGTSGIFKILQLIHTGDTRGEEWWSDISCVSVDPSAAPAQAIAVAAGLFLPP